MTLIAVPLGGLLAFVMERTHLSDGGWIEPLLLVPSFVSPMVLSFGHVVAAGPVGFYTVWSRERPRRRAMGHLLDPRHDRDRRAPATRAASSTSEPRFFNAAEA